MQVFEEVVRFLKNLSLFFIVIFPDRLILS